MKIIVAGGSGFIGGPLVRHLIARGHDVVVLSRNPSKVRAGRGVQWDGRSQGGWSQDVATADAVINLAGENIGDGRWTDERKRLLVDSRINATRALVEAMRSTPDHRRVFLSASAVGFYGPRGDEELDETASRGTGFLADLTARWEEEARAAEPFARVVVLRFGLVLGPDGGALGRMLLPFKLGAGGRLGSGQQWMPWVTRGDLLRLVEWTLTRDDARGVYNVAAPAAVRNREFTKSLARALRRPAIFPVPAIALQTMFGEMANELLLSGQRVLPSRATRAGFRFEDQSIDTALTQIVRSR